MRQRPDSMIRGLVYETLSLVFAASVCGSSHQRKRGKELEGYELYNESLLQQIDTIVIVSGKFWNLPFYF